MQHPLYELARRAHSNLSHSPERRAVSWCTNHDQYAEKVKSLGGDVAKLDALARAYLHSLSNTASAMIVGPARFPAARNEKRMRWADNHAKRYYDYIDLVERRAKRAAQPPAPTRAEKLEQARAHYEAVKATPPAQRRHSFELQYANKAVKDLEAQQAALKQLEPTEGALYQTDANRVWFVFDGKPSDAIRELLKSRAFKWTPSKGHWGRQLTPNALLAAQQIAKQIVGE
jgi:hypothetical protein